MVARFFVLVAVAQLVAMATRGVAAQMSGVGKIISESLFNSMLPNRDNASCPAKGFYTYEAFITAASAFPEFGTSGSPELMKRELAAFFGQTSQETTGQLWNYKAAGNALGVDLVSNPDLVSTDPVISFKTAIWFWMTANPPMASCHDVILCPRISSCHCHHRLRRNKKSHKKLQRHNEVGERRIRSCLQMYASCRYNGATNGGGGQEVHAPS
ncbi:hypothetical protein HU200_009617 [Digitaria exilis]|uniref:chitinase n=1 Tax=Digitaria exilis TaxID=1010633 RepID=A0A835KQP1_9POAL|nr:hypothetical protein HU200_009617 [Digitaria exilis]